MYQKTWPTLVGHAENNFQIILGEIGINLPHSNLPGRVSYL